MFNLGGSEPISLRDLLDLMIEVAGSGSFGLIPFPEEKKAIDIGSVYADYSKIERALGWKPETRPARRTRHARWRSTERTATKYWGELVGAR